MDCCLWRCNVYSGDRIQQYKKIKINVTDIEFEDWLSIVEFDPELDALTA